jgi:S1-C subfamily serine protease
MKTMSFRLIGVALLFGLCLRSQDTPLPNSADVFTRASEATAIILCGEGAGRLTSISTGVVVRPNGILLTSYHALKNVHEVQVRPVTDQRTSVTLDAGKVTALDGNVAAGKIAKQLITRLTSLRQGGTAKKPN